MLSAAATRFGPDRYSFNQRPASRAGAENRGELDTKSYEARVFHSASASTPETAKSCAMKAKLFDTAALLIASDARTQSPSSTPPFPTQIRRNGSVAYKYRNWTSVVASARNAIEPVIATNTDSCASRRAFHGLRNRPSTTMSRVAVPIGYPMTSSYTA